MSCINCRQIYGRLLLELPHRAPGGKILRRWRAVSGSAGLSPAKKHKREASALKRRSRNLRAECAGRVVGLAALIGDERRSSHRPKGLHPSLPTPTTPSPQYHEDGYGARRRRDTPPRAGGDERHASNESTGDCAKNET